MNPSGILLAGSTCRCTEHRGGRGMRLALLSQGCWLVGASACGRDCKDLLSPVRGLGGRFQLDESRPLVNGWPHFVKRGCPAYAGHGDAIHLYAWVGSGLGYTGKWWIFDTDLDHTTGMAGYAHSGAESPPASGWRFWDGKEYAPSGVHVRKVDGEQGSNALDVQRAELLTPVGYSWRPHGGPRCAV